MVHKTKSEELIINILLRRGALTAEEWKILIEKVLSLIIPHFKTFTFEKMEDFLFPDLGFARLSAYKLKTSKAISIFMSQQGCFRSPQKPFASGPTYTRVIWGITRKKKWIMATVTFGVAKGGHRLEDPTRIDIKETTLDYIINDLNIPPAEVFDMLCKMICEWQEKRFSLYSTAENILTNVNRIASLIRLLPAS